MNKYVLIILNYIYFSILILTLLKQKFIFLLKAKIFLKYVHFIFKFILPLHS